MRSDDANERARAFEQEIRKQRAYFDEDRSAHDAMIANLTALNLEGSLCDEVVSDMNLFPMHSHVDFKGLKARSGLNGKRAIVAGFDPDSRRFIVHCERHIDMGGGNFNSAFDGEQVRVTR